MIFSTLPSWRCESARTWIQGPKPLIHSIIFSLSAVALYFISAINFPKHIGSSDQTLLEAFDPKDPQLSDIPLLLIVLCSGIYFFVNTRAFYYKLTKKQPPQAKDLWYYLEFIAALYKTIDGSSSQFAWLHDILNRFFDDVDKDWPLAFNLFITFLCCVATFIVQWQLLSVPPRKEDEVTAPAKVPCWVSPLTNACAITNTIIYFNELNNTLQPIFDALDLNRFKGGRYTDFRDKTDIIITSINAIFTIALFKCNNLFAYVSICQKMNLNIPPTPLSSRDKTIRTILLYMSVLDKTLISALCIIAIPKLQSPLDVKIAAVPAVIGLPSSALCTYIQYKSALLGEDSDESAGERLPLLQGER